MSGTQAKIVRNRIDGLLREKFMFSEIQMDESCWDEPLTVKPFSLSAIELAYLLFELEKLFDIRIDSRYFGSYGFCSLNKILDVVIQCVNSHCQVSAK